VGQAIEDYQPVNRLRPPRIQDNDPLLQTARKAIAEETMLQKGDHVLVGVSGGRDSVALLTVLMALAESLKLRLGLAHYHHGMRGPAADQDARLVENLALEACLPLFFAQGDVEAYRQTHKTGIEEAARDLRYTFFLSTAQRYGFTTIALGHHADDNAELVLMRLLRGSGRLGLSGIPPLRYCGSGALKIIRPFITSDRAAIDRFCRRHRLVTREDASNRIMRFTRNRIRHDLLPRMRAEYNPNLSAGLSRMAGLMRAEEDWLDTLVADHLRAATVSIAPAHIRLDTILVARMHPALQRRVLRAALVRIRGDLRRIGFEEIEAMRRLLGMDSGGGGVDLPGGWRADCQDKWLSIGPGLKMPPPVQFEYTMAATGTIQIEATGASLRLEELGRADHDTLCHAGQYVTYFDMDNIIFPITIRSFRPGDRFTPFGLQGTQKLKKYFIDHKIPRALRTHYPLVVSGGEIIWIAGLRRGDRARVGSRSSAVLKIELLVA
jgi:tRNA(Ile)-lysidine synthase